MRATLASARTTVLWIAIVAVVVVCVLRDIAVLVGYAVLLAYALLPAVRAIERVHGPRGRQLPQGVVAGGVVLSLVAVVGWAVALAVPRIGAEAAHLTTDAPAVLERLAQAARSYGAERGLSAWLDPAIEGLRAEAPTWAQQVGGTMGHGAVGLFGSIGQLLGLALLPLLAFYLLAESDAVRMSALRFVPESARKEISRLGKAVDRALRSYVRGQAIVCVVTGASVSIGLALLHHPGALLLGLLAGAAELIPYLGFMIAGIAIALTGWSHTPLQALLGLSVYVGLNWAIGTFVTPRVMGRYLMMHPFVVTVSVLAGAQILGPAGALLALPGAAVVQALVGELAHARPTATQGGAAVPSDLGT